MRLDHDTFLAVVKNAPLVSIDLILKNQQDSFLLGKRINEPAKSQYFVPGGVLRKSQTVRQAFENVVRNELGISLKFEAARFLGVYDHIYNTNFAGINGFGTHYVVLAYEVVVPVMELDQLPFDQHSEWRFMPIEEILRREDVHENTKRYFLN